MHIMKIICSSAGTNEYFQLSSTEWHSHRRREGVSGRTTSGRRNGRIGRTKRGRESGALVDVESGVGDSASGRSKLHRRTGNQSGLGCTIRHSRSNAYAGRGSLNGKGSARSHVHLFNGAADDARQ